MSVPRWLEQLRWSRVWTVAELAIKRDPIPRSPGCYAFTEDAGALRPNGVLYIGKADNLRRRLGRYVVDYRRSLPTTHKGAAFIFEHRHRFGDYQTFVRWTEYGGNTAELEANLCDLFWPHCTDRWEKGHELWGHRQQLDPQLLG